MTMDLSIGVKNKIMNIIIVAIFSAALFLNIYRINDCNLTVDEFFSINIAERGISEIWSLNPHPNNFYFNSMPPFYETVLHFLRPENNLLLARLLSVAFNLIALYLIFLISKKSFGRLAGIFALFFAAMNCGYIYYAKMIRCYSLLNVLILLSFYIFLKIYLEGSPKKQYLVLLLIINTLAIYTFYFGILIIILEVFLSFLLFSQEIRRRVWLSLAGPIILLVPWVSHIIRDFGNENILNFPGVFNFNFSFFIGMNRLKWGIFQSRVLPVVYIIILVFSCLYSLNLMKNNNKTGKLIFSLVLIFIVPYFFINHFTVVYGLDVSRGRYLLAYLFPVFILAGLAIKKCGKIIGAALLIFVTFFSCLSLFRYLGASKDVFYPAGLASVATYLRNFNIPTHDKVLIEIEDAYFVPVFGYYFFGPDCLKELSIPYCGAKIRDFNRKYEGKYKTLYNIVGYKDSPWMISQRWPRSIASISNTDWMFLVYSDWHRKQWGDTYKPVYLFQIREAGLLEKLHLVDSKNFGDFFVEIYKVNK